MAVAVATAAVPRPPRVVGRAVSHAVVAGLAAVAAVLAAAAPTAPTGTAWFDDVLCAVVAGLVTLAAARSGGFAPAVSGVLVAVGATGATSGLVTWGACAAAGAAVGLAASGRGSSVVRGAVGAAVAACAFHLAWPRQGGGTAAVGVLALLVVAMPAVVGLRGRGRRLVVLGGSAVLLVAGLSTALGVAGTLRARADLEAGAGQARAGLAAARRGDVVEGARRLDQAAASFATARRRLRAWWTRPALAVPVVAHQSRAVSELASVGAEVAGVGARLAEVTDPRALRVAQGVVAVERVEALVRPAEEAAQVLDRGGRRLARAAEPWLAPPIRRELDRLLPQVQRAGRDAGVAARTARIAPALLGADGPRRWFLVVQSPVEQRATGGFIGSFAELSADGGRLRLDRVGRTAELNTGGGGGRRIAGPPEYLDRYGRFDPHLLWQNVNMSPDFPTVAGVVAGLYPQSGGRPVDGVIAIDPYGLAGLLRALGPVRVADWPEPITAESAPRVLLHEQYVRFPQTAERVDFLGQVTHAVWQRLTSGSVGVVDLGRAMVDALDEKHVMLASTRPDEQEVLAGLGVVGAMAPVEDDFLGVVTQNASGNKIEWFLRRAVDYRVDVDAATGRVTATARITLRNEAPASGLPSYVIGNARKPPAPAGTNSTFLSVYTPWALEDASVDGVPTGMESERELGRRAYSTFVDIPPGGSVVVELRLGGTRIGTGDVYRVAMHWQPAVAPDDVLVSVGGREQRAVLSRDRTLGFPL